MSVMRNRSHPGKRHDLTLTLDHHALVIHRRYEVVGIINDVLIALWFLAGSICFFYSSLMSLGTWLFVIGSAQMLIRPLIRLSHHLHLKKMPLPDGDF